jgi:hypothetical protein
MMRTIITLAALLRSSNMLRTPFALKLRVHHARRGERNTVFADVPQGIVTVRLRSVRRIQVENPLPLRRGNSCCNARDKIAVRIDKGEAIPAL